MNIQTCGIHAMTVTCEKSTRRKACRSATLPKTNTTMDWPRIEPCLCGEKPANKGLSHGYTLAGHT